MAVIDRELDARAGNYPTQDEEFVLMHGDSLEMNGFISHLKLPHCGRNWMQSEKHGGKTIMIDSYNYAFLDEGS